MRLIVDQIRGMEVFQAMNTLKLTSRAAAPAVIEATSESGISSFEEKNEGERVDVGYALY